MSLRILRMFLIVVTVVALYAGYDQYETREAVMAEISAEMPIYNTTREEMDQLSKMPAKTLRPTEEALEDLLGRLIDDADLLGSSVRAEMPEQGLQWEAIKHGVTKARLSFSTQAEKQAGLGYFSLVWQLLIRQPVHIVESSVTFEEDVVRFSFTVELLALQGG